jgi:hypothetical protein
MLYIDIFYPICFFYSVKIEVVGKCVCLIGHHSFVLCSGFSCDIKWIGDFGNDKWKISKQGAYAATFERIASLIQCKFTVLLYSCLAIKSN